jgi:hypothetical protein
MLGVRRTNRTSAITDQAHHKLVQVQKGWTSSLPYCLAFKTSTKNLESPRWSYLQMPTRCMYMISGWNHKKVLIRSVTALDWLPCSNTGLTKWSVHAFIARGGLANTRIYHTCHVAHKQGGLRINACIAHLIYRVYCANMQQPSSRPLSLCSLHIPSNRIISHTLNVLSWRRLTELNQPFHTNLYQS